VLLRLTEDKCHKVRKTSNLRYMAYCSSAQLDSKGSNTVPPEAGIEVTKIRRASGEEAAGMFGSI
jgi:hypothetical protein